MKRIGLILALLVVGAIALAVVWHFKTARFTPERLAKERAARDVLIDAETDREEPYIDVGPEYATEPAPETFIVDFETSCGQFAVELHRDWAPHGVDRFYHLVDQNFFVNARFYRVVPTFIAQFGISPDPETTQKWMDATLPPDPPKQSNVEGTMTFAMAPGRTDSRTTQVFINLKDNAFLDEQGFAPIGKVIYGMKVVHSINDEYGDSLKDLQDQIRANGNPYLIKHFPNLDYIVWATVRPSSVSSDASSVPADASNAPADASSVPADASPAEPEPEE